MLRSYEFSAIFELRTRLPLPPLVVWPKRGGGKLCHQTAHLVGLVLFLIARSYNHHHHHATGKVQMYGILATDEMVIEQGDLSHACVDSLQGVSPVNNLFPFADATRTQTEDAQGVLSFVDIGANHTLLGIR